MGRGTEDLTPQIKETILDELVRIAIEGGGDLAELQDYLEFLVERWGLDYEVPDLWALAEAGAGAEDKNDAG